MWMAVERERHARRLLFRNQFLLTSKPICMPLCAADSSILYFSDNEMVLPHMFETPDRLAVLITGEPVIYHPQPNPIIEGEIQVGFQPVEEVVEVVLDSSYPVEDIIDVEIDDYKRKKRNSSDGHPELNGSDE